MIEPARRAMIERIDTGAAAQPVIVFNTSGFARNEVVSLPGRDADSRRGARRAATWSLDAAEHRPVASFAHPVEVMERNAGRRAG